MADSPYQAALSRAHRPLAFAAEGGFARADRVRRLPETVARALEEAAGLAIPGRLRQRLEAAARRAREAAEAEGDAGRKLLAEVLAEVEALRRPEVAEAALAEPVRCLPGVGPRREALLARRELGTVGDLLYFLPSGYEDRRELLPVGRLEVGRRATFVGEVADAGPLPLRGRRGGGGYRATVRDGTGAVQLKWFRGAESIRRQVRPGVRLLVSGVVRRYRFDRELLHPDFSVLAPGDEGPGEEGVGIVARYPAVEGIHPKGLRELVAAALARTADLAPGHLPESVVRERGLPPVARALREVHRPPPEADPGRLALREGPAHERLILEELFLLQVGLALQREARRRETGLPVPRDPARERRDLESLPFALTGAQERARREILEDLARGHPMHRLLQGDVGSGKTVVAWLAIRAVVAAGRQAALVAPTEILAEQHLRTLRRLAEAGPEAGRPRLDLLTASLSRAEAEARRRALEAGELDLVVGTHALLQPEVRFARLALAVVDEQHRFGVLERARLRAKGEGGRPPHTLVMTATPIPRTLALTAYGDLDLSVIGELPPGRSPVATELLRPGQGRQVMERIRETLARGEQVYVVYPLVEESAKSDLRAATTSAARIAAAFPGAGVELVHGQQPPGERAAAMERFVAGESRILVSTTVIEVGVDVPRATLMVVEHAERFGLAQLHQLRGRVGRGERPGTCLLLARASTAESEARLAALLETGDGFRIADADLRIRGPGEFLGTRQSGRLPDLRIADLVRDARLVAVAREAALAVVRRDPSLHRDPALRRAVVRRWGNRLRLAEVG